MRSGEVIEGLERKQSGYASSAVDVPTDREHGIFHTASCVRRAAAIAGIVRFIKA